MWSTRLHVPRKYFYVSHLGNTIVAVYYVHENLWMCAPNVPSPVKLLGMHTVQIYKYRTS